MCWKPVPSPTTNYPRKSVNFRTPSFYRRCEVTETCFKQPAAMIAFAAITSATVPTDNFLSIKFLNSQIKTQNVLKKNFCRNRVS